MRGDVIIVEDHHRKAAGEIVDHLKDRMRSAERRYTVTVAGESGSGKSEMGKALKDAFDAAGYPALVLGQDDYFVLPPKSNDARRREDISWVGLNEVKLDLLNEHLRVASSGSTTITKPEVIYDEDRAVEETISLHGIAVVIAEGTYTTTLSAADTHVFIDRDYHATLEARKRRNREKFDPFIEQVLEIEHQIIRTHKSMAEIVISSEYDVLLP
jgi:uridine kinase